MFVLIADYLVHTRKKEKRKQRPQQQLHTVYKKSPWKKIDETMQTTTKQINKWNKLRKRVVISCTRTEIECGGEQEQQKNEQRICISVYSVH